MKRFILSALMASLIQYSSAQTLSPDLNNWDKWTVVNRTVEKIDKSGRPGIHLSEASGNGMFRLTDTEFSNGTIEFDLKGRNKPQSSFVGIAFHMQDNTVYDGIYFRPFNFMNSDPTKRSRSVQYISMPDYPWERLRENSPGKYEGEISPTPDPEAWLHVKIVVAGKKIAVYVNGSEKPSLEVQKITNTTTGGIALWVGHGSDGSFANLSMKPSETGRDAR